MSSLRNAAKAGQRDHRERSQPSTRSQYGVLEKKKDWIKRTRDFQEKREKLKKLKRQALNRNPDEFHFHMVRSQVGLDGVHREMSPLSDDETEVQKRLGDIRDLQYVRHKLSVERKKIDKLKAALHLAGASTSRNTHIFFADDDEEAKEVSKRLVQPGSSNMPARFSDPDTAKEVEKERKKQYVELMKRIEREKELTVVLQKLELKKNLAESKGELKPKLVRKGAPTKAAVYKWPYERKK